MPTKQVKTVGRKYNKITNYRAKKKINDNEMLERGQIIGRYRNNIVLNTKKNMKTRYTNFGLGSDILSMGEYFLTDDHSPFSLHDRP
jgi:hypothetical protein